MQWIKADGLLTQPTVATVTETAAGCSRKLVHKKGAAVLHTDGTRPLTAARKAEAHCTLNNPLSHCRMPTAEPSRHSCTTVTSSHTLSRHLPACCPGKPVPGLRQTVVVTLLSKKKTQANKTSSFTSNLCGIPGVNVWNPKLMGSQVSTKNSGNKEGRSMHVEGEMLYVHVK